METNRIVQIIIACLMALIIFYLIILYIKSEAFKSYSCYNIILMSCVIFLDCVLKIFPNKLSNDESYEGWEFILSTIKNFLDKMILSVLSLQVIIVYTALIHTEFYYSHEKSIFIIGDVVCTIVSGSLAFIYSSIRWVKNVRTGKTIFDENDDYSNNNGEIGKRNLSKKILEIIFCGLNFVVNVFLLVVVISHLSKKRKDAKAGLIQDLGYGKQLLRFSFIFSINVIAIIFSGVIINFNNDIGLGKHSEICQLIYLVFCFIIDLCFMVNNTVYQETLKLFCKKKFYEENKDDVVNELQSMSTFGQNSQGDDYEDDYEDDY